MVEVDRRELVQCKGDDPAGHVPQEARCHPWHFKSHGWILGSTELTALSGEQGPRLNFTELSLPWK
jgi:hypothetical protein